MSKRTCSISDCKRPHLARGYCKFHYARWRVYGDPLRERQPGQRNKSYKRPYALNEAFFDEVTTEAQAYWLGFIAADGSIHKSAKKGDGLRVELEAGDRDHLRRLCADLGSDRPVATYGPTSVAAFNSWRLVEALGRLGIGPRKSAIVEPWDGPAHLMPHYWRGLFDGDGSIYKIGTRADWCLNICGSPACVRGFAAWATQITESTAKPRRARADTYCWTWTVTGTRKPQRLAEALYADAAVALARKQELAVELCGIDFGAIWRAANDRRAAGMRAAWQRGDFASRKRRT